MIGKKQSLYDWLIETHARDKFARESSPLSWEDLPDQVRNAWLGDAVEVIDSFSPETIAELKSTVAED